MKRNRFERLERFLLPLIQGHVDGRTLSRPVRVFLRFLKGLSFVYLTLVQLRLFLYDRRILRHHTLGCQVISVGNLSVGGTGKTPVVETFARELQQQGRRVAILSRGYKKEELPFPQRLLDALLFREGRRPPRVVSDGNQLLLGCAMSGDEPYMLATNLPGVAVLVDRNRVKSGRYAISKLGCDTLILDDGFQYLSLRPRVQVVLVDKTNPFGNERVLPRGILREPLRNIRRADVIFITKSDGVGLNALKQRLRSLNSSAEIIECRHRARHLQDVFTKEQKGLESLQGMRVVALSGIAVPGGFERELELRGARLVDRVRFADHHRYQPQEIQEVVNRCRKMGADAVVTTEKDAVRFPESGQFGVPVYFLRVEIEILSGAEDFHHCIARICFRSAGSLPERSSRACEQGGLGRRVMDSKAAECA